MAPQPNPPPLARARPVAELFLDPVLARADELAQSWAVRLILAQPLADIGVVPLEEIAREGPALCAQMLRALQSDVELDRLTGDGAPSGRELSAPAKRIAALVAAHDAVVTIEALEALRGVLWEALLEDLQALLSGRSGARALADLSDRLAHVCSRALAAALAGGTRDQASLDEAPVREPALAGAGPSLPGAPAARSAAVIVDEHDGVPVHAGDNSVGGEQQSRVAPLVSTPRPLSWDESPPVPPGARGEEIEIRDERREEGPAAWIGSIGSRLERFREDGAPFAVLLVEPVEMDSIRRSETPEEVQDLTDRLQQALSAAWPGSLTRQRQGRYWLLASAANRLAARELAVGLEQTLAAAVFYRGAPLELAVGSASCPEDGLEASALAAHADVGLYAARSAARGAGARGASVVDEPA